MFLISTRALSALVITILPSESVIRSTVSSPSQGKVKETIVGLITTFPAGCLSFWFLLSIIVSVAFEIYKKLLELNTTLDKKYRYSLGEQAAKTWSDTLEQLILAKHAPKPMKASYLLKANALAEMTSIHLRAILELNLANETNVLKVQARLSEARRMIGGWHKSVH